MHHYQQIDFRLISSSYIALLPSYRWVFHCWFSHFLADELFVLLPIFMSPCQMRIKWALGLKVWKRTNIVPPTVSPVPPELAGWFPPPCRKLGSPGPPKRCSSLSECSGMSLFYVSLCLFYSLITFKLFRHGKCSSRRALRIFFPSFLVFSLLRTSVWYIWSF